MYQPISIRTVAGQRIDVFADETIEVNMGGISLLSLAERTQTYTNTFKLPRTPNNEAIFAFASQPTRSNVVEIAVVVSKGLFYQSAKLKVTSFEESYSCTLAYDSDGVISALSLENFYELPTDGLKTTISDTAPTTDEILAAVSNPTLAGACFSPMMYKTDVDTNTAAMTLASFLTIVEINCGVTFAGDVLSDSASMEAFIFNKYVTFTYNSIVPDPFDYYFQQHLAAGDKDFKSCSEVLKAFSQVLLFDVIISGTTITLTSVEAKQAGTPIPIEGFTFSKDIYSGYGETNLVKYKVSETIADTFGSDTFTSNGQGLKTALQLSAYIPIAYIDAYSPNIRGGYNCNDTNALKELIIMIPVDIEANVNFPIKWTAYSLSSTTATATTGNPLSLATVYSVPMASMATPVILEADGYLDPLTASQITLGRLIISRQMGGKYWVDEMKYNLTTGKAVLKLIKL